MVSLTYVDNKQTAKARDRRRTHHTVGTRDFVCIDGEGIKVNGEHRYVLLGMGSDQIENEEGLSWSEIFEFIYGKFQKGIAYCGFYLSYDFDRWLRTMPEAKVTRLITSEGRDARKSKSPKLHGKVLAIDLPDGWQINMLGKRKMEIRKRSCRCGISYCKHPKGPWMTVCDTGPFFQASFLKTIDPAEWQNPVVTQEEFDLISKGKDNRADATEITDEMRYYNQLENEVLARVLRELNKGFQGMGIYLSPGQWFGPGQAAQEWLKNAGIPRGEMIRETVPEWFLEAAAASYFGGWFEIMAHGTIPGSSYEYDINSAYPYAISKLPCLLHGVYSRTYSKNKTERHICYVYARLSGHRRREHAYIGCALHRDKSDRILRPTRTEGWYNYAEILAAKRAGFIHTITILKSVTYKPCKCKPPLRGVQGIYQLRLRVGKKTPLGKSSKLILNSLYGKFAQSIGMPLFANPVYASLITSGCRTMITDAIASHPSGKSNVLMVATDAVYFLDKHPGLKIGGGLGEWDYTERQNMTLFKPGVYWDDRTRKTIAEGKTPAFKARGIRARDFAGEIERIDYQYANWNDNNPDQPVSPGECKGWPSVKFTTSFSMVSCLQAIRRGKWNLAGAVFSGIEVKQNSNPYDKRIGIFKTGHSDGRIIWRSIPWLLPLRDCKSKAYEKRFGMEDPWSLERMEYLGLTPDGNVPDLIADALDIRSK